MEKIYKYTYCLPILDSILENPIRLHNFVPYMVKCYLFNAIEYSHPSVDVLFNYFNVPHGLTLKEKVAFLQIIEV